MRKLILTKVKIVMLKNLQNLRSPTMTFWLTFAVNLVLHESAINAYNKLFIYYLVFNSLSVLFPCYRLSVGLDYV